MVILARIAAHSDKEDASEESQQEGRNAAIMGMDMLRALWKGGVRDWVGGGVARYSVDEYFRLPHFEKMLWVQDPCNRALLLVLIPYLAMYAGTTKHNSSSPLWSLLCSRIYRHRKKRIAGFAKIWPPTLSTMFREISSAPKVECSMRRMPTAGKAWRIRGRRAVSQTGPTFGIWVMKPNRLLFHAEGAFYVWTRKEFDLILGDDAEVAATFWNVKARGNVDPSHDARNELKGKVRLASTARVVVEICSLTSMSRRIRCIKPSLMQKLPRNMGPAKIKSAISSSDRSCI